MARQVHLFDRPSRFIAGTVGQPGDRTFYLQASEQSRLISVALEKQQVQVLAEDRGHPFHETAVAGQGQRDGVVGGVGQLLHASSNAQVQACSDIKLSSTRPAGRIGEGH